jgi:hypothetical protein
MAASSTAHEGAASIHEIGLVVIWEVFHAGRGATKEAGRAEPCSHLKRLLAYIAVKRDETFGHTQVPQSPPQTWLNKPLRHSPLDILRYGSCKAGGGSVSEMRRRWRRRTRVTLGLEDSTHFVCSKIPQSMFPSGSYFPIENH